MKKPIMIVVACVLMGGFVFLLNSSDPGTLPDTIGAEWSGGDSIEADVDASEENERLRAQIRQKDALIAKMMIKNQLRESGADDEGASAKEKSTAARAAQALDDRIDFGNQDSDLTKYYKNELQSLIDTGLLEGTELVSLRCSLSLCRVILSNDDRSELEASTRQLAQRSGKILGAQSVFNSNTGEKFIYMAADHTEFNVHSKHDSENVVFQ